MRDRIITAVLVILTAAAMLAVWPRLVIRIEVVHHNGGAAWNFVSLPADGTRVQQFFTPQGDYLRKVQIDLGYREGDSGTVHFGIVDGSGEECFRWSGELSDMNNKGFTDIPVAVHVKPEREYHWYCYVEGKQGQTVDVYCTLEGTYLLPEDGKFIVQGMDTGCAGIVGYVYGVSPGKTAIMTYWAFLIFLAVTAHDLLIGTGKPGTNK